MGHSRVAAPWYGDKTAEEIGCENHWYGSAGSYHQYKYYLYTQMMNWFMHFFINAPNNHQNYSVFGPPVWALVVSGLQPHAEHSYSVPSYYGPFASTHNLLSSSRAFIFQELSQMVVGILLSTIPCNATSISCWQVQGRVSLCRFCFLSWWGRCFACRSSDSSSVGSLKINK